MIVNRTSQTVTFWHLKNGYKSTIARDAVVAGIVFAHLRATQGVINTAVLLRNR
ncbi:hypothetical protein PS838_01968 [Pseudomonas fluorescens]|jgi:hypothetical protein|nr:hypothetical protein PS838_01968 [Pseudomonas fluorescens]